MIQVRKFTVPEDKASLFYEIFDAGPNPDDLMNKTKTNQDGEFYVDGMEEEISTIEPILKIYHDCNDGLVRNSNAVVFKITF